MVLWGPYCVPLSPSLVFPILLSPLGVLFLIGYYLIADVTYGVTQWTWLPCFQGLCLWLLIGGAINAEAWYQ